MRGSMRCPTCNTIMEGGVPRCPQCAPTVPPTPKQVFRLPLLDEYVARGYAATNYDEFIANARAHAAQEGIEVEIRPPTGDELIEYEKAVKAHLEAQDAARLKAAEEEARKQPPVITGTTEGGADVHSRPTAPLAPSSPPARAAAPTRNLRAVEDKKPKK